MHEISEYSLMILKIEKNKLTFPAPCHPVRNCSVMLAARYSTHDGTVPYRMTRGREKIKTTELLSFRIYQN